MREILKVSLGIARDVPILRVKRAHTGAWSIRSCFFVSCFLFLCFLRVKRAHTGARSIISCFFVHVFSCVSLLVLHHVSICFLRFVISLYLCLWKGSNVRGAKPVTVYFGKYEDKEEVLRQVKVWWGGACNSRATPLWSSCPLSRYFLSQCEPSNMHKNVLELVLIMQS